jgi:hypothetical protein
LSFNFDLLRLRDVPSANPHEFYEGGAEEGNGGIPEEDFGLRLDTDTRITNEEIGCEFGTKYI